MRLLAMLTMGCLFVGVSVAGTQQEKLQYIADTSKLDPVKGEVLTALDRQFMLNCKREPSFFELENLGNGELATELYQVASTRKILGIMATQKVMDQIGFEFKC